MQKQLTGYQNSCRITYYSYSSNSHKLDHKRCIDFIQVNKKLNLCTNLILKLVKHLFQSIYKSIPNAAKHKTEYMFSLPQF